MKTPHFRQIDLAIPAHWSPEQALAVFELLDDLRDKIWAHYGLRLQQLLAGQQQTAPSALRYRAATGVPTPTNSHPSPYAAPQYRQIHAVLHSRQQREALEEICELNHSLLRSDDAAPRRSRTKHD